MKKFIIISVLFFFLPFAGSWGGVSFAQNKVIDSLLALLKKDKSDTAKVNHLYKLTREYEQSGDLEKGLNRGIEALELARKLNFKKGIANSLQVIGSIYDGKGNYPDALKNYFFCLKIREELGDQKGISATYGNIGIVYNEQGDYTKALDYYFRALKMAEQLGNKKGIARHLSNIGNVYKDQADFPKALDFYFKALKMKEEQRDKSGIAINLGNIGDVYRDQGASPKALEFYFKALKIAEEMKNKNRIAIQLGNIGSLYTKSPSLPSPPGEGKKGWVLAEKYLKNSIAIEDSIGALDCLRNNEALLSQLYDTAAKAAVGCGQWAKAAENYKRSITYFKKATALKDTIFSQENKKQLVRKEMNYEFDKKETAAKADQAIKDAVTEADKKKQLIIIWSVAIGLLLVIVFAGFIFRSLSITRKQKQIIEIQNRKTELQKKIIEEKHKEITDSINYAERIQRSFLASKELLNENLKEHFVFFQPKDVVSGDFYWAAKLCNGNFTLVTADSTGHGVPGAIMSILNISSLEKAVEQGLHDPSEIFGQTRKTIIERLKKDGSAEGGKDGMDASIICFDFANQKIQYAAANNPIWVVRENNMIELQPDKMPVGRHDKDLTPFTQTEFQLQKGDIIYTSTDGFADQFGGPKGKKFMAKQLKELLLSISHLPMNEQKQRLSDELNLWKNNLEQVDDITIIGVRI